MNHPLANSPTITDSLREWLCTFPDLNEAKLIQIHKLYTILPKIMNSIDPDIFTIKMSLP